MVKRRASRLRGGWGTDTGTPKAAASRLVEDRVAAERWTNEGGAEQPASATEGHRFESCRGACKEPAKQALRTVNGRQLGNTPQAFSHFPLVMSALQIHHGRPHRTDGAIDELAG